MRISTAIFLTGCVFMASGCPYPAGSAAGGPDRLLEQFQSPPDEAKLRVWWWWGNGPKGTKSLTADLEAMKANEIAGVTIIDATFAGWGLATSDVFGAPFMSPEWREQFKYAVAEADRLGIEVSVNLASGWNAGGPWMPREHGPKRLTFTTAQLSGPGACDVVLPIAEGLSRKWHRDIRVLAVPVPSDGNVSAVEHFREKAFHRPDGKYVIPERVPDRADDRPVSRDAVLDITEYMDSEGRLKWNVPAGKWLVLRMGYALSGDKIKFCSRVDASEPGDGGVLRGYEVDPLSRRAAEFHFEKMAKVLAGDSGELAPRTLKYFHVDSWERIVCNWAEELPAEFQRRRGYSIWPYLPVLAGIVVDGRSASNRFLYDFRLTISDMIVDNYYGRFRDLSHELGMRFHAESGASSTEMCLWDQMKAGGAVDLPMGEAWVQDLNEPQRAESNWHRTRPAASAAHIYGSPFAANEQFTSARHWLEGPYDLKPVADRAFYNGCNRFFWHTYSHSAIDVGKPGHVYFAGTHFNRNITWWDDAVAFSRYIARCQYLLSRGNFVADICFYYGDEIPNTLYSFKMDDFNTWSLAGFDYDITGKDAIIERMSVKNGCIVLPDGVSYRMLVLADREMMSLELLEKLQSMVKDGATVIGAPPRQVSGLSGYPRADRKLAELVNTLWGRCDGINVTENRYGKGRVIWEKVPAGPPVPEDGNEPRTAARRVAFKDLALRTLARDGVAADFSFKTRRTGSQIRFIHRRTDEADIYFVHNTQPWQEQAVCSFRVRRQRPELWDPAAGASVMPAVYDQEGDVTSMPMSLDPYGSVFVVFRSPSSKSRIVAVNKLGASCRPNVRVCEKCDGVLTLESDQGGAYELLTAAGESLQVELGNPPEPLDVEGPWDVSFPAGWGAPENARFDRLLAWNKHQDDGIRYFSGTATYVKNIELAAGLFDNTVLYLDLGEVQKLAGVWVNGTDLGVLWKEPFRVDVSDAARPGTNRLKIRVTNTWANRLIGDSGLPAEKRLTETNVVGLGLKMPLSPETKLLESGLLGPVRIIAAARRDVRVDAAPNRSCSGPDRPRH